MTFAGLGGRVESMAFVPGIHSDRTSSKSQRRNISARPLVYVCSCEVIWYRLKNVDGLVPVSESRGG
jgi:hypothetical protein